MSRLKPKKQPVLTPNEEHPVLDKNVSLVEQYFQLHSQFSEKYGDKTVVLMEVGTFMELYGIENEDEIIGCVSEICDLLNLQMSRRNKMILENNRSNPLMAGFPSFGLQKYCDMLVEEDYTVILVEQVTSPPEPDRRVTKILSPSTYIDTGRGKDCILMTLWIENVRDTYSIGRTMIDISTGRVSLAEYTFYEREKELIPQQILHWLDQESPREVLWIGTHEHFLDIYSGCRHIRPRDKNVEKITYQNAFLKKWYPEHGFLSPIEYLGLERHPHLCNSFIYGLQFAYEHDIKLIEQIQRPIFLNRDQYVEMYNEGLRQLQVFDTGKKSNQIGRNAHGRLIRLSCLLDVLDGTLTPMGKREIRNRLGHPIWSVPVLQKRWDEIETYRTMDEHKRNAKIAVLKTIKDVERLFRKIQIGTLTPYEIGQWMTSMENSFAALEGFDDLKVFFKKMSLTIDLDRLNQCSNTRWVPFLTSEVGEEWAEYLAIEKSCMSYLEDWVREWERKMLDVPKKTKSRKRDDITETLIRLDIVPERPDSAVLLLTAKRASVLSGLLREAGIQDVTLEKYNTTLYHIVSPTLTEKSRDWTRSYNHLEKLYPTYLQNWFRQWISQTPEIQRWITELTEMDVSLCNALVSLKYNYCRPTINEREGSFLRAENLRHPLVERFEMGEPYVPHSVALGSGEESQGYILTGLNSSGKTVLMKSMGLSVLLAQAGMYVPASSYEFYPFRSFFTRISGEDNLLASRSSFAVEMMELKSILDHADKYSLLLGDELCRGTEQESALSIVASTLDWWLERKIPFVTATHLYPLFHLKGFTSEDWESRRMYVGHLWVEIDRENGKLKYYRTLKQGLGESLYGLEVAGHIIQKPEWSSVANKYRLEILGQRQELIQPKMSKYNPYFIVDKCEKCGSSENLETHHKREQHTFEKWEREQKDDLRNLEVLCKKCHQEHHHDE